MEQDADAEEDEAHCRAIVAHAYRRGVDRAVKLASVKALLDHEARLLAEGHLANVTHPRSSSAWLCALSGTAPQGSTLVYRPMGDVEALYLVQHGQLPDTQPYQAIMEGQRGRLYAEKYLSGAKWTDTSPSTVVEFCAPLQLMHDLRAIQCKAEDGALSHGLGHKAGKTLHRFNDALRDGRITWRIVKVKRNLRPRTRRPKGSAPKSRPK